MFGQSFDQKVKAALAEMGSLHIKALDAKVEGKVVTLTGEAPDKASKAKAMEIFNTLVETENTINMLRIAEPVAAAPPVLAPAAPAPAAHADDAGTHEAGAPRIHEVVKGDTLSAIAKKYYGKASEYPKIFEANQDVLRDPDHIHPGQKLRIP